MKGTPERSVSELLGEEIHTLILPSGLPVLYCPKPGFKKKYACYATFYGSVDSEFLDPSGARVKVPDGIAHFLEHTLFETEEGNVSDLFARHDAYNNAATSFTTTSYLFAATERFYDNLDLLIQFVENPVFRPENVEKEKGIIEQEISGYDDSAPWVSYMGLLENLFAAHPIRIDIAGTAESIAAIDSETLHQCYRKFYHPSNMLLFVVGDLDASELFDFVSKTSRPVSLGGGQALSGGRIYPDEPRAVAQRTASKALDVALPKLLLGFKEVGVPASGEAFVQRELASELLLEMLFGASSDMYKDLYESQLILEDFGASYSAGAGIGYAVIGGDTPDPVRLEQRIVSSAADLVERGLTDEDFEREKRHFMGGFIRDFNSLEYIANHYTYYRFHDFDLFDAVGVLARLEKSTLEARARELLDPENYATFVVEPRKTPAG